ncbi:putative ankyrin repeat protein RF_0381 isoform X2 [Lineus longissimus]
MPELLDAICAGDNAWVRRLIQAGVDVNVGEFYMTPLQMAIMKDNMEAFNSLIKAGADVNQPEETKNWQPLTYAAKNGNLKILDKLLEMGAAVNIKDSDGRTLLDFAVHGKHLEVVRRLVQMGADIRHENCPDKTTGLMYTAMMSGCTDMVVRFRAYGLNFETIHTEQNEPGIFRLIQFNQLEMLDTIIKLGGDVNIENMWGETPLFRCSDFGASAASIHLLMRGGADVNKQNSSGETALGRCIMNGNFDKVRALLDWGANMDYHTNGTKSLLHMAVERGLSDIAKLLVNAGTNLHGEVWIYDKLPEDLLRNISIIQWMTEHARTPMSLKWYSRLAIRKSIRGQKCVQYSNLPLPKFLRDYLYLPNMTDIRTQF